MTTPETAGFGEVINGLPVHSPNPKPEKCRKGLHGPEDITRVNQKRGDLIWVIWRCNACVRARRAELPPPDAWWSQRKTFAKLAAGREIDLNHRSDRMYEVRMKCGHPLFFRNVHLPLRRDERQWCYKCDDYFGLMHVDEWDT